LASNAVEAPYAVVTPYSTRLSDGLSVVQVMEAPVMLTVELTTAEMTGAVVSGIVSVVNVRSEDTASLPAESFDFTL
jgi:hypothetical protein